VGGVSRAFRAPGRVNLIGEHTDYNDGFVLPLAIGLECLVRVSPRDDAAVRAVSENAEGAVEVGREGPAWGRYVEAVASVLAERGRPAIGADLVIDSTVPVGAGLSSSAALEVGVALALCDVASFALPPLELARACQEAEQRASGVPCGIMDQLASISGRAGRAVLIDCRSLEVEPITLPDGVTVVVVHSGLPRVVAESAYAERRAECERVAASLGLPALRDATLEQVADEPRARHVVSENERVLAAVDALRAGNPEALGPMLTASHASLRDDFEVSTPELDLLVAELERAGALGARLTGAGFGGCVVALVLGRSDEAARIAAVATSRYASETGLEPQTYLCRAVDGAGASHQ
jgi:galactokinase